MGGLGFGLDPFGLGPFGSAGDPLLLANAFASSTNSVRVTFNTPPRQSSMDAIGDVLNPDTWVLTDSLTGAFFTVLTVVPVSAPLVFDIFVLEPFTNQEPLQVFSSALLAPNGDLITPPRFFNFFGVAALAMQPSQLAATRKLAVTDIANPPAPTGSNSLAGTLVVTPGGDYATETGTDLLKKLIIRRLTTPQGAFFHLPNYGVGLRVKEKLPIGDLVKLKAQIESQVKQEPEVQDVSATVSLSNNILTVLLAVKERSTGTRIDIPLQSTLQGFQL